MVKNILLIALSAILLSGCFSSNLLRFGELDSDVANKGTIINNFEGNILNLEVKEDTEAMNILLPKDNLTLRLKIKVSNIEDVLYMNLVDKSGFKINKIAKRVSSLDQLNVTQDGWMFEPSLEKGVVTLQLYLPEMYLYKTIFSEDLLFSYKRSGRSVQESIKFNFIRQRYFPTKDDNGYEVPAYNDLKEYCNATDKGLSLEYLDQVEKLNTNRLKADFKKTLKGICD